MDATTPDPESLAEVDRLFCVDDNPTVSDLKRAVQRALAERDARIAALEAEVAELELTIKGKTFSYPPDERDERIKALEAEVASVTDSCRYWRESFFDLRDSKRNNVVLDDAIRELHEREAQLRWHGQHTDECKRFGTPPECTCGWTAIEEGLDGD